MIIKSCIEKFAWIAKTNQLKYRGTKSTAGFGLQIIGPSHIEVGNNFVAGKNLSLQTWGHYLDQDTGKNPRLRIGDNVSIMNNCMISCMDEVQIGDGCLLGDNVFIADNYHGDLTTKEHNVPPIRRKLYSKGTVIVGKNVWLGRNVCVMPGVIIGDGAIIGANSVVTKNVAPLTCVAGCPARVIKRYEDTE